ncbi:unnamed protein product [Caenorhabditis sp. 36 PRJEB53466]|nr:unnamed protein product [Caenorhabditis sp. 36 PRJEB53466]
MTAPHPILKMSDPQKHWDNLIPNLEMVVGQFGRFLKPSLSFTVEGLTPDVQYTVAMGFRRWDTHRWWFNLGNWEITSRTAAAPMEAEGVVVHPAGLMTGEQWNRASSIPFSFVRITSRNSFDEKPEFDKTSLLFPLWTCHKYIPFVIIESHDKKERYEYILMFATFMAVGYVRSEKMRDWKKAVHVETGSIQSAFDVVRRGFSNPILSYPIEISFINAPSETSEAAKASETLESS